MYKNYLLFVTWHILERDGFYFQKIWKHFRFIQVNYTPVTLEAVYPTVRDFTPRQKHLQGCIIPFEILCIIHTTDSITWGYRHWVERPCPSTAVWCLYANLRHSGEMSNFSMHLMSPYYTETRLRSNLIYTMDHTPSFQEKFICTCSRRGGWRRKF